MAVAGFSLSEVSASSVAYTPDLTTFYFKIGVVYTLSEGEISSLFTYFKDFKKSILGRSYILSGCPLYLDNTSVNGTIHDSEFGYARELHLLKGIMLKCPILNFKYVSNDKYEVEALDTWDHHFTASNGLSLVIVPNSA
jgi:hypothetical protein